MLKGSRVRTGQVVRLREHVIAAFRGARLLAARDLSGNKALTDAEVSPPKYCYIYVTRVKKDPQSQVFGTDLHYNLKRAFEYRGGYWYKIDPLGKKDPIDVWGYDELKVLSPEEVVAVIEAEQQRLDDSVTKAREDSDRLQRNVAGVLKKFKERARQKVAA